jgi:hypothetical protein
MILFLMLTFNEDFFPCRLKSCLRILPVRVFWMAMDCFLWNNFRMKVVADSRKVVIFGERACSSVAGDFLDGVGKDERFDPLKGPTPLKGSPPLKGWTPLKGSPPLKGWTPLKGGTPLKGLAACVHSHSCLLCRVVLTAHSPVDSVCTLLPDSLKKQVRLIPALDDRMKPGCDMLQRTVCLARALFGDY